MEGIFVFLYVLIFSWLPLRSLLLPWRPSNPICLMEIEPFRFIFGPFRRRGSIASLISIRLSSVSDSSSPCVHVAGLLSDNTLKHLNKMRSDRDEDLCLRIGVKLGGCSGMFLRIDLIQDQMILWLGITALLLFATPPTLHIWNAVRLQ